jgi:hypothetical protein
MNSGSAHPSLLKACRKKVGEIDMAAWASASNTQVRAADSQEIKIRPRASILITLLLGIL